MKGCFYVKENDKSEYDIQCLKKDENCDGSIPEIQTKVYLMSEDISKVIRLLIGTNKEKKDEYFDKLLSATRVGLVGDNAQPEMALLSLEKLKSEMLLNESGRIKNNYMTILGIASFIMIVISSIIIFILKEKNIFYLNKYIFIFQGAMIGAWVSFGARKIELKFEELGIIEKDFLNPILRLILIGTCSIILYLFISCNIVSFKVGSFSSDLVNTSIEAQYLFGIICGLLEYKIAINIYDKASTIVKF
ncbi:hypothetical protein ACV3R5_06110 [Clostridium perfringens]|uniref:hypothetical protein n=1 Tax=Clostridium perfringens TaxID=1502 RepID=UPI0024BC3E22|nr:hypothetical protein [Clostridium perfringens]